MITLSLFLTSVSVKKGKQLLVDCFKKKINCVDANIDDLEKYCLKSIRKKVEQNF